MNIKQLKMELEINNINLNACLIHPSFCPDGALCLTKNDDDSWSVSRTERGEYTVNEKFFNESDACKFFFKRIITTPTYRNDFKQEDLFDFDKKKEELLKKYNYI
jgi:hypothetical protein